MPQAPLRTQKTRPAVHPGGRQGKDGRGLLNGVHSNETVWPWYSNVAPVSWLVQHDVDEGREHLNFSTWNQRQGERGEEEGEESEELVEVVREGSMPPRNFLLTHPEARLSDAERAALIEGLAATTGVSPAAAAGDSDD